MSLFRKPIRHWIQRLLENTILKKPSENIYRILGGHIYFQTMATAVRLDLFSLLAQRGKMTLPQIAEAVGIQEKPARIVLLGCTALGLLRKRGDRYRNTWLAGRLLDRARPDNIIPVVLWQHFINYRAMAHFYEAARSGSHTGLSEFQGPETTLYGRLTHHPELEKIFQDAMESISVQSNRLLAEAVDFSRFQHILDVGGGNGSNIIQLARRHPSLRATVFDSHSVCVLARAHIRDAGLADRLDSIAGDAFQDEFPAGVDGILFAHFMTIWSEAKNRELLRKAHRALPSGGAAIIFNMMQHDDGTGPLSAAMGSPYFLTLATGEGMLYTCKEYAGWMRDAGFSNVFVHRLVRDHGVILGIK
ncbi:MAG TPA: methyltransferase [Kiritimatiellia bacterium]|nr:methyltransferase [Kiritimatiellia bacterium]HRZ12966.1 methyltransferase [Kiritimatiellia bacterium]HSA18424.1 methyltransferase [Kiritimatiellia bacterium]